MKTNQNDKYCVKSVRVRMGDKKTYYTTGNLPNVYRTKSQNEDIFYTEHIQDDGCNWDDIDPCPCTFCP